jgi:hypothetical protein
LPGHALALFGAEAVALDVVGLPGDKKRRGDNY